MLHSSFSWYFVKIVHCMCLSRLVEIGKFADHHCLNCFYRLVLLIGCMHYARCQEVFDKTEYRICLEGKLITVIQMLTQENASGRGDHIRFFSTCSQNFINYLTFLNFEFERTWWWLFHKGVVRTKFDIYVFILWIWKKFENCLQQDIQSSIFPFVSQQAILISYYIKFNLTSGEYIMHYFPDFTYDL